MTKDGEGIEGTIANGKMPLVASLEFLGSRNPDSAVFCSNKSPMANVSHDVSAPNILKPSLSAASTAVFVT